MIYEMKQEAGHSPRVTRKRRERMQHILRTALAIARDEGRDALTMQRLAERLDYTPGALYRYFASKDALVAELQGSVIAWLEQATRQRIEAADAALAGELAPGERALLAVLMTGLVFEHFARTQPVEFGLLSMHLSAPEFALPAEEAARVFQVAWASLDALARRIDAAAAAGALGPGDAHERALALWAGLQGVVQTRKLARSAADRIDPTRIAHGLLAALLEGWGADPATRARLQARVLDAGLAATRGTVDDLLEAAA